MPAIGGEIEQLQDLKRTFDVEAKSNDDLKTTITNKLNATVWQGPAADRFRTSWEGEFSPMLTKLTAALAEAGLEVQRRTQAFIDVGS